jgi:hypothetical protein
MTGKSEIVARLGESAVLLPGLVAAALAANDRIKLRLTLLQEAAAHLENPQRPVQDFTAERQAADLAAADFDRLVTGACALTEGRGILPGAAPLIASLRADLAVMLAPLVAARPEVARTRTARAGVLSHVP